ncbi:hypothetical protein BG006_002238 [Podila minutissima]|uniref:Uncharacterized protein n=1 Tax=Podila minutissima TaxID=64525 RepID=A0A9P5SR00_9FUNG|nr:hypothetical protein BG006_002238 [Podila minutissima]
MSLKATAKEFIPSFAATSPAQEGAAPSVQPHQEPPLFQKTHHQQDPQVATRRPRFQQQQQNNAESGQKERPQRARPAHAAQRGHPPSSPSSSSASLSHDGASSSDHAHKDRPHKLPQHTTNGETYKDDHRNKQDTSNSNSLKSAPQQQQSHQQPQSRPKRQQREKTTDEKSSHPQHPDASKEKSANGSGSSASKPKHNTGASTGSYEPSSRSHNNNNNNKSTNQRGSGARSGAKTVRKASTDRGSAPGSSTSGAGAKPSTASTSSSVVPGMEPTAFICLTDVIHPVRQVIKDGVSTMEQGSDAYLDWIIRSLKEHEEITLIGMEAAIPDMISLVLRAGKLGIGYQEIRTFTTQDGLGGNKSCIQFRMLRGQGYIALEKRPSALF